ncbi:hypothetical protein NQ314_011355 [Rhamnusium bicolor]|uniref:Uncharacterized protein n=1 Tax=Rhamnusium bicolor TaxID=1586634 RepID=A0AAV8XIL1_9CUCU|nr:hypothetical protein NQ314_011355 [Rhamnusium bicolor]
MLQIREKIIAGLLKSHNENVEAEIDDPLPPPTKKIRHRSSTALHRLQKYEGTARNTRHAPHAIKKFSLKAV